MTLTTEQAKIISDPQSVSAGTVAPKPDMKSPTTMKSSSEFIPGKEFSLILAGPPGSAKTTTALQLCPTGKIPAIFDLDKNLSPAARYLGPEYKYLWDQMGTDTATGLSNDKMFDEVYRRAVAVAKDDQVGTIIVDSATMLCQWGIDKVLREHPTKTGGMELPSWGYFYNAMFNFCSKMRDLGKWFVLICHEVYDKDEVSGIVKYKLNIPGRSADIVPGLFSDYWRTEIESQGNKRIVKLNVLPGPRVTLRCSLDLPDKQVFDPKLTVEKIMAFQKKPSTGS